MKMLLSFILLVCSTGSYAQYKSDSLAVMSLIQNDYVTYANLDIESHRKNCTDDYILIENGQRWDIEKEVEYMKSLKFPATRKNQFENVVVKVNGSTAFVVYTLISSIIRNGVTKNYQWTESVILEKVKDNWKLAVLHSTLIREW